LSPRTGASLPPAIGFSIACDPRSELNQLRLPQISVPSTNAELRSFDLPSTCIENESKPIRSGGSSPGIFLFFARIGSEVVAAQGVASKRFFAFFGLFRATKKGRFLGFGFLVVVGF
jgi:hypothetical protein